MENKNNNIFLGKLQKQGCYVNNGKYGYFITTAHDKKNYKLPEWLYPDEVTLDMAKRLIAYKQKISEEWLEKKNSTIKDESDDESSENSTVKKLTKL